MLHSYHVRFGKCFCHFSLDRQVLDQKISSYKGENCQTRFVVRVRLFPSQHAFTYIQLPHALFVERGGDARFDEVKNKFGLFLIYWTVQAIWVFCISLPVIFINSSDKPYGDGLTVLDYICIVAFASAVLLEIVADVSKAVWVKAGRQGGFCNGKYLSEIFLHGRSDMESWKIRTATS